MELAYRHVDISPGTDSHGHHLKESLDGLLDSRGKEDIYTFEARTALASDVADYWRQVRQGMRRLTFEGVITYKSVVVSNEGRTSFAYYYDMSVSDFVRIESETSYS